MRDFAEAQIKARQQQINTPMKPDEVYEREFIKGEMAGVLLFMNLPSIAIEQAQATLGKEVTDDSVE